jgi:hypothetical protein
MSALGRSPLGFAPLGAVLGTALALLAAPAAAQDRVRDLELNGGLSVEAYRGNLAAATASVTVSTEKADAAIGEIGARGTIALLESERRWIFAGFDAGMRQFAAQGFVVRDYAPREWVGQGQIAYTQLLGDWATATTRLGWRGRAVKDRPPMPLFLQPGFGIGDASVKLELSELDGVRFDVQGDAEWANYSASRFAQQLDLLDRHSQGFEAGASWGDEAVVRVFGGMRLGKYANQLTFDPKDPYRRDRTVQAGVSWTMDSPVTAELGVDGTVNRSNSQRPEYDAVSARGLVSVPLPFEVGATLLAVWTEKEYVNKSDFKVLVPGEEADNASVIYLDLSRPVALGLDASLRLGWTRAEADVGNAYFQRFGMSMLLRYRPGGF